MSRSSVLTIAVLSLTATSVAASPAFIKTIPPRRATGKLKQSYWYLRKVTGSCCVTPRIFNAFSLRPDSLRRIAKDFDLTMWRSKQPRRQLELLGSMVSRLNACHY